MTTISRRRPIYSKCFETKGWDALAPTLRNLLFQISIIKISIFRRIVEGWKEGMNGNESASWDGSGSEPINKIDILR